MRRGDDVGNNPQVNTTVVELALAYNTLGGGGAIRFAELLKVKITLPASQRQQPNHCLSHHTSDACLFSVGLVTLQTNTTLVGLDLSSNSIGVAGALALAETLRVNTSLKCV